jgi:hypothetical protein
MKLLVFCLFPLMVSAALQRSVFETRKNGQLLDGDIGEFFLWD